MLSGCSPVLRKAFISPPELGGKRWAKGNHASSLQSRLGAPVLEGTNRVPANATILSPKQPVRSATFRVNRLVQVPGDRFYQHPRLAMDLYPLLVLYTCGLLEIITSADMILEIPFRAALRRNLTVWFDSDESVVAFTHSGCGKTQIPPQKPDR
jgi:hypothetical protein